MIILIGLIIYSALIGGILAVKCRNVFGCIGSLVLPFAGLYIWSLIESYVLPYSGGGAPMREIAFIIVGPVITLISIFSFLAVGSALERET
jgi:hypothetical protein